MLKTFSETHRQDLNSILIKFPPKKLYCFRFRVQRFDYFKFKDPFKDKNIRSLKNMKMHKRMWHISKSNGQM